MTRVALLGARGFVGSAVHAALLARGAEVVPVAAPRLCTAARTLSALREELAASLALEAITAMREAITGCDVVVIAAGVARAAGSGNDMFGANALLPGVVASALAPGQRLVHVSSAAVQGRRRTLDESDERAPFSPYSASKAIGEEVIQNLAPGAVIYRPTSVQGPGRPATASLLRVLRSPLASAAAGHNPTPQVLVGNVGDAVAFLATTREKPPSIVMHPWEGLTTRDLYLLLGGRRPLVLPRALARAIVSVGYAAGRISDSAAGVVRRLEMLWFGQEQEGSWLQGRWEAPLKRDAWRELS